MQKTMRKKLDGGPPLRATVGYAANSGGDGVAYVALHGSGPVAAERVAFKVRRHPALRGREVGYVALREVALKLLGDDRRSVRFIVDDESLAVDLNERRALPGALAMPYVALRCVLNRFSAAEVVHGPSNETGDLRARALAEVSLRVAA